MTELTVTAKQNRRRAGVRFAEGKNGPFAANAFSKEQWEAIEADPFLSVSGFKGEAKKPSPEKPASKKKDAKKPSGKRKSAVEKRADKTAGKGAENSGNGEDNKSPISPTVPPKQD